MTSANKVQQNVGALIVEIVALILKIHYTILLSIFRLIVPEQPKAVRGEIVLVTGAGHGIGKELALLYASEGATVVVWDINETTGKQTVTEIAQQGCPKAHFFKCNVANRDDVLNVAKEVHDKVGHVTILINNAGIMPTHSFLEHSEEEIEKIIDINVMAHFWTLQAFLPSMKAHNHGHIVCLSSYVGLSGIPNLVPYSCSKYAVRGLMDALYEELRANTKNAIKCTTIYPSIVDTGLAKKPNFRFKNLPPLVNPKVAAAAIMDAQRRDIQEATIPRSLLYAKTFFGFLPLNTQQLIKDFLGVQFDSDLL